MTKTHQAIINFLKRENRFLTAHQIAAGVGVTAHCVHRAMQTKVFENYECYLVNTGEVKNNMVKAWRIPQKLVSTTETALRLAKEYKGLYGQLYWSNNKEVLYGMPTHKTDIRGDISNGQN
jgi:hypothetical protein